LHTNGVELLLHLQEDLPWVLMDENQMKQVLLNLVHNALQAMPGGGQLEIRTAAFQKVGREGVIVSVRDSGVGIPPEIQTRIFEPFFTTKANRGGTGLGLSVTYGIVSAHGGEIELISQPGSGSTFTVWLPKG
jgi:signal transduction histidine kinase